MLLNYSCYSQIDVRFERLGYESGIPENYQVTSIVQDSTGFLWIACLNALMKYDGYNLKLYKLENIDSLLNNLQAIRTMFLDRKNNLWLMTDNGLSMYVRERDAFVNYPLFFEDGPFFAYQKIQEDSSGLLWIATKSSGLFSFNTATRHIEHYLHDDKDPNSIICDSLRGIVIDNNNNVWISTYGYGLEKFDISNKKFTHHRQSINNTNTVGYDFTGYLYKDRYGAIWIGLDNGRFDELDPVNTIFKHYSLNSDASINSLYRDETGLLWIATGDNPGGVILFDKSNSTYTQVELDPSKPFSPTAIYEDKSGVIWLGVIKGGLYKFIRRNQEFRYYGNELNQSPVRSIAGTGKTTLWCGTYKGFEKLNLETGKFIHFDNEQNNPNNLVNNITSLLAENDSMLWIGTRSGLFLYDINRNMFKPIGSNTKDTNSMLGNIINEIYKDSFGDLWLATESGLNRLDRKTGRLTRYTNIPDDSLSLPHPGARAILEDKNNILWIGSFLISRFNRENSNFTNFSYGTSVFGVSSLCEGSGNNLWVTSYIAGLIFFDKNTGMTKTYMNPNVPDNYVCDILPDNSGKLWLSYHHGLSCFDPEKETYRNYGKEDGLMVSDFYVNSAYKSSDGVLYFGGDGGVIFFNPDSIKTNTNVPKLVLTDFKIFNQSVIPAENSSLEKHINVAEEINLDHKDNSFSFEFAALDYNSPERNQYAYKLEGFDKAWIKPAGSSRTASYTNIDPGEYVFRVKGSNNDGVWNEEGISVKVVISPPWWLTWWFRGSSAVMFFGLLGFVRQRKLSRLRREMQQREEFTKQLINTQEAERKRIAGELHDSLGQNLLIIKNKALVGIKNPGKNTEIIEDISKISSSSLQEVREISYNLHPYQLEQLGLTKAIESIIERASGTSILKFEKNITNIDNLFSAGIEINLFRMIQECINNVLKHSGASAVYVTVSKMADEVSVMIEDNGIGFDVQASRLKKGLGLMSLFERAKISGAKIDITSQPGNGTTINISISIPKN